jgi:hypothetical protein
MITIHTHTVSGEVLLGLASTVILGSESRMTNISILLAQTPAACPAHYIPLLSALLHPPPSNYDYPRLRSGLSSVLILNTILFMHFSLITAHYIPAHRILLNQAVITTTIISLPEVLIINGHPHSREPCVAMKALQSVSCRCFDLWLNVSVDTTGHLSD